MSLRILCSDSKASLLCLRTGMGSGSISCSWHRPRNYWLLSAGSNRIEPGTQNSEQYRSSQKFVASDTKVDDTGFPIEYVPQDSMTCRTAFWSRKKWSTWAFVLKYRLTLLIDTFLIGFGGWTAWQAMQESIVYIKVLLQINQIWSPGIEKYLLETINS